MEKKRKIRRSTLGLLAGFITYGSMLPSDAQAETNLPAPTTNTGGTLQITPQQDQEAYNLSVSGLDSYKKQLAKTHTGQIALGMCIGWTASEAGKITVTVNPGIDYAKAGNMNVVGIIFSYFASTKGSKPPQTLLLNGPYSAEISEGSKEFEFGTLSSNSVVTLMEAPPSSSNTSSIRHISAEPIKINGTWEYVDLSTHDPVIKSEITNGPLTAQHIASICSQLDPSFIS